MAREKIPWPGGPAVQQEFSFQLPVIRYMAENPSSPKCYEKLIQSCKYFFEMKALLVVHRMRGIFRDGIEICSYNEEKCQEACLLRKKCCIRIVLYKIPNEKIWLADELYLDEEYISQFAAIFRPKFYRCKTAKFCNRNSVIAYNDLKVLAETFKKFYLEFTGVYYRFKTVPLEGILRAIPDVEEFSFMCSIHRTPRFGVKINNKTFANICKLDNLGNLKLFELEGLHEFDDVDELAMFVQEHKDTKFYLNFYFNSEVGMSEKFKAKLDSLIDVVLDSNVPYRLITYHRQDKQKLEAMKNLCDKFFLKKLY